MSQTREIPGTGTAVFYDGVCFSQIPHDLICESSISVQARLLYGIYHRYCLPKSLMNRPNTFVSQNTLGKILGLHQTSVSKYTKELEEAGWLSSFRRGLNKTNIILLHAKKKNRNRR